MLSDVFILSEELKATPLLYTPMNLVNTPVVFAVFIMPEKPTLVKLLFQEIIIIKLL